MGLVACQGADEARADSVNVTGMKETGDLFANLPQQGITLGNSDAPITLTEFADLQCPGCRQFTLRVLPAIIQRYVRTGQVKIVFRNLAFVGPESTKAARMAAAVGLQDHLWQFVDLFYRNQGQENSGYVTDAFLRRLALAVPGVDARRATDDRMRPAVDQQIEDARREAEKFGIQSTPSFLLGKTGETPRMLDVASLTPEPFARAIDGLARAK